MSFVPECSSYFVHKIERLSLRRSRSRGVFAPDQVQMRHLSQATRFVIFHPERSLFSVYMIDTRMKFRRPRKRISFAMETGKKTLRNVLYGKEMSFQYRVIKIRTEKYIMEMPNELVPEWKSFRYHVNSPLTSSPETYIYKAKGIGIIKITFESMGIHRIWGIFYSFLRSFRGWLTLTY